MANLSALITLIFYNLLLISVGLWAARKAKTEETFLLGGRSLGPWVAGLAYAASTSSAWVLLGFSGFVYAAGPSALWMVPGILVGYAAIWLWSGKVLQTSSREMGHLTLTDFLSEGAGPATARMIRIVATLMIAFCFSYFVAAQFQGAGVAFDGLFDTGLTIGVILGAVVILIYVLLGGFLAVSITDTIQGILMAIVAVVLPAVSFFAAGGFGGVSEALAQTPDNYIDLFGGRSSWLAVGFVLGLSSTGFGALGQPHLVAWIMAAKDRRARVMGAGVAIGWGALVYAGMGVLGLSARAIYGVDAPAEGVFFQLSDDLLPGILGGVVAAATLSAIMSTVDSQFIVVGAAISHDMKVGKAFGGRDVLVSRVSILALCVAAVLLTLYLPSSIFDRVLFAWVALGATFGPIVVARTLGHMPSGLAALLSMIAGFSTTLAYEFLWESGPGSLYGQTVPWIAGFVVLAVLARVTRSAPQQAKPAA